MILQGARTPFPPPPLLSGSAHNSEISLAKLAEIVVSKLKDYHLFSRIHFLITRVAAWKKV